MSAHNPKGPLRRSIIAGGLGVAVAAGLSLREAHAAPTAKTLKTDVQYQYHPNGAQHCGLCASFIPGDSPQGSGTCQIVDGNIPQGGWCALFSARR